jgi:hypothetical protein
MVGEDPLADWLFQGQFSGKPFRDFIPPAALEHVGLLLDDPAVEWPWPYGATELDDVRDLVPLAARLTEVL